MKMILQHQKSINKLTNGKYSGDAIYLTELLFEQIDYLNAASEVIKTLKGKASITKLSMFVDGYSGNWGCSFHYRDAEAPLPLAFDMDDSPAAIFYYYIDYAKRYCDALSNETDENGNYKYRLITDINDIKEINEGLELSVIYDNQVNKKIIIPYPMSFRDAE